uniref:IPD083Fz n=1 Tax=Osmunda regalis TaxID=3285 RepID=A0A3S6ZRD7_OSMRE|nr:IPD083Fz [Osmunda regalis]
MWCGSCEDPQPPSPIQPEDISMASVDYGQIYQNVNQITRPVATKECSEVMAIHRMYLQLDNLDVELLTKANTVKQLVVFVDVVEIESDNVKLPGSSQVTIVCRILHVKKNNVALNFDFLGPTKCNGRSTRGYARIMDDSPVFELSIYAQQLVGDDGAMLRVRHPVTVATIENGHDYEVREGNMEWQIWPYSSTGLSSAARSHELKTIGDHGRERTWLIIEQEWSRFIAVVPDLIPLRWLTDSNVLLGMEATLLTAELILSYQTDAQATVAAALQHVEWLNTQLLQVVEETDLEATGERLLSLLFRAQSLLKLPVDGSHTLIVPRLEYGLYRDLINRMTDVAEKYNSEFMQMNLFIQQNEILGTYLLEQNKVFAQKEKDMEVFHSSLVTLKQQELTSAKSKMAQLETQLTEQKAAMDQAKKEMDEGLRRYNDAQVANAFFAVILGVASIGLAILTGGATAGAAVAGAAQAVSAVSAVANTLGRVVDILEGLQKVMEVLEAINDLTTSLAAINEMVEAPQMPDMPSEADWAIFENEIEAVAESMPTEVSEVPTWKAKCKNVAAVCREITTTATYIGQLQYDLLVQSMQQQIAMRQAERLEAIQPADLTNYLEMATELDMRTSRMLLGLLKVLTLQNGALLYHFLLPPKPFTGWVSMDIVRNALVQHDIEAVIARTELGPSTDFTRTYVVEGIPVTLLLEGDDWNFTIPVHDSAFPSNWSRVRIRYLEMRFSSSEEVHQPTTNTGEVYILLQAARMFDDRLKGDVLHYQAAVPLQYQYAYDLNTGETTQSNLPSEEHTGEYMRMTPFTRWRLRLSASAYENQGLAFPTATALDSTTQISITFFLTAIRQIDTRFTELMDEPQ